MVGIRKRKLESHDEEKAVTEAETASTTASSSSKKKSTTSNGKSASSSKTDSVDEPRIKRSRRATSKVTDSTEEKPTKEKPTKATKKSTSTTTTITTTSSSSTSKKSSSEKEKEKPASKGKSSKSTKSEKDEKPKEKATKSSSKRSTAESSSTTTTTTETAKPKSKSTKSKSGKEYNAKSEAEKVPETSSKSTTRASKKASATKTEPIEPKEEEQHATKKRSTTSSSTTTTTTTTPSASRAASRNAGRAAATAAAVIKAHRARSHKPSFNPLPDLPTQRLNVYVFGSGSICELGLGPLVTEVKRPRLNPLLPIDTVGIVKLAVGGAHAIALDYDGRVWSWGQNDSGVLGRLTKESEDEIDDDWIVNSKESTPGLVEGLPASAIFVEVAATDNLSVAVTDEGHLWAWGTFIDDGQKCFKTGVNYQREPIHITTVKNVVKVAAGKDHLLILDKSGDVFGWGVGSSFQLGVHVNPNLRSRVFGPLKIPGLKKIKHVSAGEYHSFAINQDDKVFSWGLNNFGQAGNPEEAGDGKVIKKVTHASFFDDKKIVQIAGGNHHSLALTADGEIYAFGEMNFHQLGLNPSNLPECTVREADGTPAYVPIPTKIEGPGIPKFKYVAVGTDHSLAISAEDGSPWTWGFGETYQLGHGKPAGEDSPEDEEVPTKIDNTATRGVTMTFAGAGGQFSVLAGLPRDEKVTNGVSTSTTTSTSTSSIANGSSTVPKKEETKPVEASETKEKKEEETKTTTETETETETPAAKPEETTTKPNNEAEKESSSKDKEDDNKKEE